MTITAFGVEDLAGNGDLFVNVPRSFIVDELPVALDPHRVVLEVLENVPADEEVVAGVERLRRLCDYVKVDMSDVGDRLADFADELRAVAPHAALVAEHVEDEADFLAAQ